MMVSHYDDSRFLIVLQVDHSRVAGLLAAHWGNATFAEPRPYASVVLAAQEHDTGWWEWEVKPTVNEQGAPIDYIGSVWALGRAWLDFNSRWIPRVVERDPYAGLLVLMHNVGLVNHGYGRVLSLATSSVRMDELGQEFVREHEALRVKLLDELRQSEQYRDITSDEHTWTNYKLMEVFDRLAQFICNRYPFNSTERRNGPGNVVDHVPVAPGKEDGILTVNVLDEKRAVVRPYPFDVDPLEIAFPARLVPRRTYGSQEEFLREYYKGERLTITYALQAP
ncbi:MAG: DUF3891 family protein [Deltaproteobacteria bacterium]|nr:DUF3891 family protein [Deltaproteobacteria bacterium]